MPLPYSPFGVVFNANTEDFITHYLARYNFPACMNSSTQGSFRLPGAFRLLVSFLSSFLACLVKVTHSPVSCFFTQAYYQNKLKLALIGQSLFGQEVYTNLRKQGHKVVGVFTVPDKDGKADPLGE